MTALAWTPFAFVVTVVMWRMWTVLSGLIEWEDTDATGTGRKLTVGGTTAVTILTFGALAYGFGAGAGALTTLAKAVGVGSAPAVGAPNPPNITATVYRTQGDSLWISGGTFAGSGSDTHDSTLIKVDSTAGGKAYHLDTLGAIERDSVGGNVAALDSGAVIDIVMKYKGASGGWSAPDTLTGVVMTATMSFAFSINDMDNAGISGDTLVVQGFPMPEGAIDTAHVVDSVEVLVNGAEVGAYVEHRGLAYSDGSARVIFTQFRADPSTETTGSLCYSGCTVDSVRIAEQSWTTTDTAVANITTGDSLGHYPGLRGYHPVMALPTDSSWLVDASPYPLATVAEVQAFPGVLAEAGDTILERIRVYSDALWDSIISPKISGAGIGPWNGPYTTKTITVNGTTAYGVQCEDWTSATSNYANWRKALGQSSNAQQGCRGGMLYYDFPKTHIQYGMMRAADSVGVEMMRRGFAMAFHYVMYWTPDGAAYEEKGGVSTGLLYTYFLTGDDIYRTQIASIAGDMTRTANTDDFGDGDGNRGEARLMAYTIDPVNNAVVAGATYSGRDFPALRDSLMVWSVNGRGGSLAYSNGIFSQDSAQLFGGCTGTYDPNARPTNTFMIALMVNSYMRVWRATGSTQFVVATDTFDLPTVLGEIKDTVNVAKYWDEPDYSFLQWSGGQPCASSGWENYNLDAQGIYTPFGYIPMILDSTEASILAGDTVLSMLVYDSVSTVSYDFLGGWGNGSFDIPPNKVAEALVHILDWWGWRQCVSQGDC